MEKIIIIGAGGICGQAIEIAETNGFEIFGILDDKITNDIYGYPILGRLTDIEKYKAKFSFIIAIANVELKDEILEKHKDCRYITLIDKNAIVSKYSTIGNDVIIMPGAIIGNDVCINNHTIIGFNSVLEHNINIGNCCYIGTSSLIGGYKNISDNTIVQKGEKII
jgi:NDP-sugar pyrophosphorylase family protein